MRWGRGEKFRFGKKYKKMRLQVFISHSTVNKSLAQDLYNRVGSSRAVMDQYDFRGGREISQEIESQIRASQIFVIILTGDALDSAWVQKEIDLAEEFYESGVLRYVYPLLSDSSVLIDHDARVRPWLRKFLGKSNLNQIARLINGDLRTLSREGISSGAALEHLYVGRLSELGVFEEAIYIDRNSKFAVVSGVPGVGRRSFLVKALKHTKLVEDDYEPVYLTMDSHDSVDVLAIQLMNIVDKVNLDYIAKIESMDIQQRLDEVATLLSIMNDQKDKIIIIDDGALIMPSGDLSSWFSDLVLKPDLPGRFTLSVVSRFRISDYALAKLVNISHIPISPLSELDTSKLLHALCRQNDLLPSEAHTNALLEILDGTPTQVRFAVTLAKKHGTSYAVSKQDKIKEYNDDHVRWILKYLDQQNDKSHEILIVCSQFDFISTEILTRLYGPEVYDELEKLYVLNTYEQIGPGNNFIRISPKIRDYISRSRVKVPSLVKGKLKDLTIEFFSENSEPAEDISEIYYSVTFALKNGQSLPAKYYLPSLVLRAVKDLYDSRQLLQVVQFVDQVMERKTKVNKELKYQFNWYLCMALARMKEMRALEIADGFELHNKPQYHFLRGFYYRVQRDMSRAKHEFEVALSMRPDFRLAKRELVLVYEMEFNFIKALPLAKSMYDSHPHNIYNIHAYFNCLARRFKPHGDILETLQKLVESAEKNFGFKASLVTKIMRTELRYYSSGDLISFIKNMKILIDKERYGQMAMASLAHVYRVNDMNEALMALYDLK